MLDHSKYVLAAIIPRRRDNLLWALQHLAPEHFRQETHKNIFMLLERYWNVAGDVMPKATLLDMLERSGVDPARRVLYEELFEDLENTEVTDHVFRYSIEALKDLRAEQLTGEAITTSFEILERGVEVEEREMKGHREAREYLYSELSKIDKLNHAEAAPEGDMRVEGDAIRQDYADRKSGTGASGVRTGIPYFDASTSGFQPGELVLVCAYTGEGKSMLSSQTAWYASVMEGKNVFVATSETTRTQVRRRIMARHTRLPMFARPSGLNVTDIKNGTLSEDDEKVFNAAVDDLTRNPTYGRIHIAQVPRGATLGFVEARLQRAQQSFQVDLLVIDYLALLKPDRHRASQREELLDIIKDTKTLATSFAEGQGIPIISPWQMSQTAYKLATTEGAYRLASLADTSEAEKSADVIVWLLRRSDTPLEVKTGFLKNRDGDVPPISSLEVDYRCAYLGVRDDSGAGYLDSFGSF